MSRGTRSSTNKSGPVPNYAADDDESSQEEEVQVAKSASEGHHTQPVEPRGSEKRRLKRRSSKAADRNPEDKSQLESVQSQLTEIFSILKNKEDKVTGKSARKSSKKKGRRVGKRRPKRRRTYTDCTSTDTSDDQGFTTNSDSDEQDADAPGGRDYIPRLRFDMESATGKHAKNKKSNKKPKLRYPRPYMLLPRSILEQVQDRESYDDLSFEEYVLGLAHIISSTHKGDDATTLLLNHLKMVAEDTTKFKWGAVRAFTNSCFDKAARSELTWRSKDEIRDERMKLSWIAGTRSPPQPQPCHAFNTVGCSKEDRHVEGDAIMRHRCTICWHAAGLYECTHAAHRCNRREELGQKQNRYKSVAPTGQSTSHFKHNQYKQKADHRNKEDQAPNGITKN